MNAQKRAGDNKVPNFLQALIQPCKPMQRIAPSKIQHAHSRSVRPRLAMSSDSARLFPDRFPGAACIVFTALSTTAGGVQMIYVDAIQHYPRCRLPYKDWCHMATDGPLSELHQIAARLDLRRSWFQDKPGHPHYDLTPAKRALAIRLGAQAVSTLELIRRCYPQTLGQGMPRQR